MTDNGSPPPFLSGRCSKPKYLWNLNRYSVKSSFVYPEKLTDNFEAARNQFRKRWPAVATKFARCKLKGRLIRYQ